MYFYNSLICTLLFVLLVNINIGCYHNGAKVSVSNLYNDSLKKQLNRLSTKIEQRNHCLFLQQEFEGNLFDINRIKTCNSFETKYIKNFQDKYPVLIYYNTTNVIDTGIIDMLQLLNNQDLNIPSLFLSEQEPIRNFKIRYPGKLAPFNYYYIDPEKCRCEINYNYPMLFVLGHDYKMHNVYILQDENIKDIVRYLRIVNSKHFKSIDINDKKYFYTKNKDTISYCNISTVNQLIASYIHNFNPNTLQANIINCVDFKNIDKDYIDLFSLYIQLDSSNTVLEKSENDCKLHKDVNKIILLNGHFNFLQNLDIKDTIFF